MDKETQFVEFKTSFDDEQIIQTLIAFANTTGGAIYIGLADDCRVIGVTLGKGKKEQFINKLSREVKPALYPTFEEELRNGKQVIKISISKSGLGPHFYKGITYRRYQNTTLKITEPSEIQQMFYGTDYNFDSETHSFATVEDIDEKAVEFFYAKALAKGRITEAYSSLKAVLTKLGLLSNEKLTNAALLLFGKNPSAFFPLAVTKAAEFIGTEMVKIDQFEGPLFYQIDEALLFYLRNIPKTMKIEGLIRQENPPIPQEVIREALTNALTHRDYKFPSFTYLTIASDFVEVKNPGALPLGITQEDLFRIHSSIPRNYLIAQVMFRAGYIEQYGSGTVKMIESMRIAGFEDLVFEETQGFFKVRFSLKKKKFNERQNKAIQILNSKGFIKATELAKLTSVSIKTAKLDLDELLRYGLAKKEGAARSSRYVLT